MTETKSVVKVQSASFKSVSRTTIIIIIEIHRNVRKNEICSIDVLKF